MRENHTEVIIASIPRLQPQTSVRPISTLNESAQPGNIENQTEANTKAATTQTGTTTKI